MEKFKVSLLLGSVLTAGVGVFAIAAMPVDQYYRANTPGATNPNALCQTPIETQNCKITGTERCTVTVGTNIYVVSVIPTGGTCKQVFKPQ